MLGCEKGDPKRSLRKATLWSTRHSGAFRHRWDICPLVYSAIHKGQSTVSRSAPALLWNLRA